MYTNATQDKIMHGLFYLNAVTKYSDPLPPKTILGYPGRTKMISCSGKTGFYLHVKEGVDGGRSVPFSPSMLGHRLDRAYHYCYLGPPSDNEIPIPAYQIFDDNWDVLVAGQANCDYRGRVMSSEKDFRL
jgi:hypothetical protein